MASSCARSRNCSISTRSVLGTQPVSSSVYRNQSKRSRFARNRRRCSRGSSWPIEALCMVRRTSTAAPRREHQSGGLLQGLPGVRQPYAANASGHSLRGILAASTTSPAFKPLWHNEAILATRMPRASRLVGDVPNAATATRMLGEGTAASCSGAVCADDQKSRPDILLASVPVVAHHIHQTSRRRWRGGKATCTCRLIMVDFCF